MISALNDGTGQLAEIRALNRHLVSAQDAKILKIVAMVDALPDRGEADSLIAPLRPRLAQLRPQRPMNAPRLLFLPLDPVLVTASQWRRGGLDVPRTVVPCLARQVGQLDPALMREVADEVAGTTTGEHLVVARVGARLWPRAAQLLATAPPPEDWDEATGLNRADHEAIRAAVVLVLRHAVAIFEQADAGVPDAKEIGAILADAADQPAAMGVLISVILHSVPAAAPLVLSITSAHSAATGLPGRTATERAVEHVLDGIEAEQEAPQSGVAGMARLRTTVAMLDELEAGSLDRPARKARIAATRARVDRACRTRFASLLQETVVERLAGGLPQGSDGIAALELASRDLRRLEHVARRAGGADYYDRQLCTLINSLSPDGQDDPQVRVDRLRLAEILLGSERAMQLLLEAEKDGHAEIARRNAD